jgi:hypothetical protein
VIRTPPLEKFREVPSTALNLLVDEMQVVRSLGGHGRKYIACNTSMWCCYDNRFPEARTRSGHLSIFHYLFHISCSIYIIPIARTSESVIISMIKITNARFKVLLEAIRLSGRPPKSILLHSLFLLTKYFLFSCLEYFEKAGIITTFRNTYLR